MARIIVDAYMVHYPLGGMLSWVLQYLVGFHRLGHDIYFVERAPYPGSCYDPATDTMSDDCTRGVATVHALLTRFGLGDRWCYVSSTDEYHGLQRGTVAQLFETADVFVELGTHGQWLDHAERTGIRVLVDAEPGFSQMLMEHRLAEGYDLPGYDHYYSDGLNVGTPRSSAPTAGRPWRTMVSPVVCDLFAGPGPPPTGTFTTVMNWRSHRTMEYGGRRFGQKDVEFERFMDLPRRTCVPLEVAVSGPEVPFDRLRAAGWLVRPANDVSASLPSYWRYLRASSGEFSVCKNIYVDTNSGWFSDRSGVYLASGRPVILQDTGFSAHLPTGTGLLAVRGVDEAAEALDQITDDPERHARAAREIARDCLDARIVLTRFLDEITR